MSLLSSLSKGSTLKSAIKQVTLARQSEGGRAEQLYKSAYEGFAKVIAGDLNTSEALYNWGFALLHEAKSKDVEQASGLYQDAIDKFSFCLLSCPTHLGAAIDGGVGYMDLARINNADPGDEFYDKAMAFFDKAGQIQKGSAAYNQACIYALRGEKDACLDALELAKQSGSLPDEENMMNDPDMASVRDATWFQEFLGTVAVALAEEAENERRTRRGLREAEEVKLDVPPRPTDPALKEHHDKMIEAEVEKLRELEAQKKREAEELADKKKSEKFDYYK